MARTLLARYAALNEALTKAEQRLAALTPPFPVWHTYATASTLDDAGEWQVEWAHIGLAQYRGRLRLLHSASLGSDPNGYDSCTPVVECPAGVRYRAAGAVGDLHLKLVKELQEHLRELDAAIAELTAMNQAT